MISSGEKNYKYFIGYKDDDYEIKLLSIILTKSSVKSICQKFCKKLCEKGICKKL